MTKVIVFFCFFCLLQSNCGKSTLAADAKEETYAHDSDRGRVPPGDQGELADPRKSEPTADTPDVPPAPIVVGAERLPEYLPRLRDKTLALVVNQTSMVDEAHLVDTLLALGQDIKHLFAPEHGFRDMASAGEVIEDGRDPTTGLPIISLYGSKKEPAPEDLVGIDLIIFDIQDVGVRFYTYISTMHYVMRAAARAGIPVMVLDRPNPNGQIVDGPVMEPDFTSFVGIHAGVPVLHGMTVGEYALMTEGEGWLGEGLDLELTVITCANYRHERPYELPVPPSPNLPNQRSIYLYPSLCFFEGTTASIGRGTDRQFQLIGHPAWPAVRSQVSFTPTPGPGSRYPKLEGQLCRGWDYTGYAPDSLRQGAFVRLNLQPLIEWARELGPTAFINRTEHFDRLAGSEELRQQILAGRSAEDIRAGWADGLVQFSAIRSRYLLYAGQ